MSGNIAAVILAAGGSSRLGRPKQLLQIDGRSLLRRAADTALASVCRPVLVVLGAQADLLRQELAGLPVQVLVNGEWGKGLGASIRCGVKAVQALDSPVDAALLMLCDQPAVTAELLDQIAAAHRAGSGLVACEYSGTVGVPALLGRRFFAELLALPADRGAKDVLLAHAPELHRMAFPAGATDIDTVADYDSLTEGA